jgi:hypothetical protein
MTANAARGGCPIAHLSDIGYTSPMETIFDHAPTPDELRYLADPDATAYRARVTADEALEALSMLFAMRGDAERSAAYARRMSDQPVGWGDKGTPTIGSRGCWGSFLTPTYRATVLRFLSMSCATSLVPRPP